MSFQQGLSGLNGASKNLEVIGNNIANANTFGSKVSRAEFADVYAVALSGAGTNSVGIGTHLAAVAQQFTQGSITTTENPMDLAINGGGFFQLSDGLSPTTYSRNGQFKVDRDGFIVNNDAKRLMGYRADGLGQIQPGRAVPLQLPTAGIKPNPTSQMQIEMNLDSRAPVTRPTGTPSIRFNDADTYNNATSLTIYDQKGQNIALTYYFQKVGTDQWNVYATVNGTAVAGTNADPQPVTTLQFPTGGGAPTSPSGPVTVDIPAAVNEFGADTLPIPGVSIDFAGATQFGAGFGITDLTQDGYAAGVLSSLTIESSGIITASYSNGQTQPAGQVELATFRNPQGLQPNGGNEWSRSFASGDPVVGVPGEGNLGTLQSGALEESNIDLTGELVNMITAQRIYQANAQTVKTQDQMMQTLVNLR